MPTSTTGSSEQISYLQERRLLALTSSAIKERLSRSDQLQMAGIQWQLNRHDAQKRLVLVFWHVRDERDTTVDRSPDLRLVFDEIGGEEVTYGVTENRLYKTGSGAEGCPAGYFSVTHFTASVTWRKGFIKGESSGTGVTERMPFIERFFGKITGCFQMGIVDETCFGSLGAQLIRFPIAPADGLEWPVDLREAT